MIECISTKEKYTCITNISNYTIISDTGKEKGGSGEGIRPHELLATAFASCLNISIRMACEQLKIPCETAKTKVELIRDSAKTTFTVEFDIDENLSEVDKENILRLIINCPVKQTLSKPIEFDFKM